MWSVSPSCLVFCHSRDKTQSLAAVLARALGGAGTGTGTGTGTGAGAGAGTGVGFTTGAGALVGAGAGAGAGPGRYYLPRHQPYLGLSFIEPDGIL